MRNRKHIFFNATVIVLVLTSLLCISSCEKEDTGEFVARAEIVTEYVRAEDYMGQLFALMHSSVYDTALINNGQGLIDSIFVTYQMDTISGIATFLFDFDSPNQPVTTQQIYSGQITAKVFEPFTNEGAVMQANFYNLMINNYELQGVIYYQNTGEVVEGNPKYLLQYGLDMFLNGKILLSYSPIRDIFWLAGFDTPHDVLDDEFSLNQGAEALYYDPSSAVLTLSINAEFTEDWIIGISCSGIFRQGTFNARLGGETIPNDLNGEFIDADYDNCADKLMIKNSDKSLGYPYYL